MRAVFFLALLLAQESQAATISVDRDAQDNSRFYVALEGTIVSGDDSRFETLTKDAASAVVVLRSNGGLEDVALNIGRSIRRRSFSTLVVSGHTCASACAMIWMAGAPRIMQPGAKIGFHAAYNAETHKVSAYGNALAGKYYGELGVNDTALEWLTDTPPDKVAYLTVPIADALGIDLIEAPLTDAQVAQNKLLNEKIRVHTVK